LDLQNIQLKDSIIIGILHKKICCKHVFLKQYDERGFVMGSSPHCMPQGLCCKDGFMDSFMESFVNALNPNFSPTFSLPLICGLRKASWFSHFTAKVILPISIVFVLVITIAPRHINNKIAF